MRIHRNCLVVPVCALGIVVGCSSGSSSFGGDDQDSGMTVEQGDGAPNTNGDSGIQPGTDGGNPGNNDSGPGGNKDSGPGQKDSGPGGGMDAGGGKDSGPQGGAITCPGPGNPKSSGSSCGSERWNIKTGTDSQASSVSLVPKVTTIATLTALPAAGGGSSRETPTETTVWELRDITLSEIKSESDDDYHLVIADGSSTMIAEIPSPHCDNGSPWACFISKARSDLDAKYSPGSYPAATVTIRGVGFFDFAHGQTGVAPNAIELHPVLQICFGQGCTPS